MTTGECHQIAASAVRCARAITAVVATTAGVVAVCGLAHDVRHLLGFGFGGIPHTPGEVVVIAGHNGELCAAALVAASAVSRVDGRVRRFLDAGLSLLLLVNASAVGVALGAYENRAVSALAPHTPIEFAAFAIAGGAYMHARKQPVSRRGLAATAAVCTSLLGVAAVLETYVPGTGASR